MQDYIKEHNIKCPTCGKTDFTEIVNSINV